MTINIDLKPETQMKPRNSNEYIHVATFTNSQDPRGYSTREERHRIRASGAPLEKNPWWNAEQLKMHSLCWKKMRTYSKFANYPDYYRVFYSIMGDVQFNVPDVDVEGGVKAIIPGLTYPGLAGHTKDLEMWLATQEVEMLDMTPAMNSALIIKNITDNWI